MCASSGPRIMKCPAVKRTMSPFPSAASTSRVSSYFPGERVVRIRVAEELLAFHHVLDVDELAMGLPGALGARLRLVREHEGVGAAVEIDPFGRTLGRVVTLDEVEGGGDRAADAGVEPGVANVVEDHGAAPAGASLSRCAMITSRPACDIPTSGEVAQLVEHVTENHGVDGSIPPLATISKLLIQ